MLNIKEALLGGDCLAIVSLSDLKEFAQVIRREALADYQRQSAEQRAAAAANGRYLTKNEAAEMLKVSRQTLVRWEKAGYLVPVKVGNAHRYRVEDVEAQRDGRAGMA